MWVGTGCGTSYSNFQCIGGNDQYCGNQAQVNLEAVPAQTLYVMVGCYYGCSPVPSNFSIQWNYNAPSQTSTITPSRSITPSNSQTATGTPSSSTSGTPSNTGTTTPSTTMGVSITGTPSLTGTRSASMAASFSRTGTKTITSTVSASVEPTPTVSASVAGTPSITPTGSDSNSGTPASTGTATPASTGSATASVSGQPSRSRTKSAAATATKTKSKTASHTKSKTKTKTKVRAGRSLLSSTHLFQTAACHQIYGKRTQPSRPCPSSSLSSCPADQDQDALQEEEAAHGVKPDVLAIHLPSIKPDGMRPRQCA